VAAEPAVEPAVAVSDSGRRVAAEPAPARGVGFESLGLDICYRHI
jgi:hypothetical protein